MEEEGWLYNEQNPAKHGHLFELHSANRRTLPPLCPSKFRVSI